MKSPQVIQRHVNSFLVRAFGVFTEGANAIVTIRKAKEVRMSYEKLLNAADTYLQLAQLQYINGVTSYMDVLDAQRGLLDAQLSLNKAMLDELLSTVYLYKALGGGWE